METKNELLAKIATLELQIKVLQEQANQKLQKPLEEKDAIIKLLVGNIQSYQQAFRSYLRNTQGALENALELEAYVASQLNSKKPQE